MTTTTDVSTMRVHTRAVQQISDIATQATCVSQFWSAPEKNPDWARRTTVSAAKALAGLFSWGEAEISYDSSALSLFVRSTSVGMVFGVIAHPIVHADRALDDDIVACSAPVMGRFCFARLESGAYCCAPVIRGQHHCDGHDRLVFAAPMPFEWSFHS